MKNNENKLNRLLNVLASGRKNKRITPNQPIKALALCGKIGNCAEAELRSLINELRKEGIPVASNCFGYYIAIKKSEINQTLKHLTSRVSKVNKAIRGLKKASFRSVNYYLK